LLDPTAAFAVARTRAVRKQVYGKKITKINGVWKLQAPGACPKITSCFFQKDFGGLGVFGSSRHFPPPAVAEGSKEEKTK